MLIHQFLDIDIARVQILYRPRSQRLRTIIVDTCSVTDRMVLQSCWVNAALQPAEYCCRGSREHGHPENAVTLHVTSPPTLLQTGSTTSSGTL
jgi:hypothetical protein